MSGLANALQMVASSSAALVGLAAQAGVTPRQVGVHPDGYTALYRAGQCGEVSRETPTEACCSNLEIRHGIAAHA